jgi:hypothetical protein
MIGYLPYRVLIAFVSIVLLISCGRGYKSPAEAERNSPENVELGNLAFDLSNKAEELHHRAPDNLSSTLSGFVETAHRFSSSSQRFGATSLEARNAFDRLRYHSVQLESVITKDAYPELIDEWNAIRAQITTIGKRLGYKLGSD